MPGVCVKVTRLAGAAAGARASGGRGPGWLRGGSARAAQAGPRWGRGAGVGRRRRRAGLAPDLTFWVRACVPEARWGRGRGREAGREVPGWLASAPFSSPSCGPCRDRPWGGPRGKREGSWRPARPGHALDRGDPPLRGPGGSRGRRPGSAPRAEVPAPRPSGESWRRRGRARGWLGPCFHGPSLTPPPSGFRGLRTEGRESGTRAPSSPRAALGLTP